MQWIPNSKHWVEEVAHGTKFRNMILPRGQLAPAFTKLPSISQTGEAISHALVYLLPRITLTTCTLSHIWGWMCVKESNNLLTLEHNIGELREKFNFFLIEVQFITVVMVLGIQQSDSLWVFYIYVYIYKYIYIYKTSRVAQMVKSICLQCGRPGFNPWVRKIPWRGKWQPIPVLLPGKSHGWMEEPGRLQSMGSQRVRHGWASSLLLSYIYYFSDSFTWEI